MNESIYLLPRVGELVVGTVKRIVPYGAYVTLDEYNDAEGLLHISEVSSRWVKNIRSHVRENQKTVLKVLRVDTEKRHINLSLRRVTEREKRERLLQWKRDRRGKRLFDLAANRLGVDPEDARKRVGHMLEDRFGSLYAGFESAVLHGDKVLTQAKIPANWTKVLSEIAESRIRIPMKKISGTIELTCRQPNGVEVLRDAFKKAKNVQKPENADVKIYVTGVPQYRIEVLATNYKDAETLLKRAVTMAVKTVKSAGGEGGFTRE